MLGVLLIVCVSVCLCVRFYFPQCLARRGSGSAWMKAGQLGRLRWGEAFQDWRLEATEDTQPHFSLTHRPTIRSSLPKVSLPGSRCRSRIVWETGRFIQWGEAGPQVLEWMPVWWPILTLCPPLRRFHGPVTQMVLQSSQSFSNSQILFFFSFFKQRSWCPNKRQTVCDYLPSGSCTVASVADWVSAYSRWYMYGVCNHVMHRAAVFHVIQLHWFAV